MSKSSPSLETQQEALKVAKATQKPGQTKEQTKLIAQGIQSGIELYKRQQKQKARERDKLRKKQLKEKNTLSTENDLETAPQSTSTSPFWLGLPWGLLVLSWIGFLLYFLR